MKYTTINGIDFIDLGLPHGSLWAKCNLGATEETEIGQYYSDKEFESEEGIQVKIGVDYRFDDHLDLDIPEGFDAGELVAFCSQEWTDNYKNSGVAGMIFTSLIPGFEEQQLFLPACGVINDGKIVDKNEIGEYALPTPTESTGEPGVLIIKKNGVSLSYYSIFDLNAISIRPISTQRARHYEENNIEAVDLGLSVLWSNKNIDDYEVKDWFEKKLRNGQGFLSGFRDDLATRRFEGYRTPLPGELVELHNECLFIDCTDVTIIRNKDLSKSSNCMILPKYPHGELVYLASDLDTILEPGENVIDSRDYCGEFMAIRPVKGESVYYKNLLELLEGIREYDKDWEPGKIFTVSENDSGPILEKLEELYESGEIKVARFIATIYSSLDDKEEAYTWLEDGAMEEDADCQLALGRYFIEQNLYSSAKKWLKEAAKQGLSEAKDLLNSLPN